MGNQTTGRARAAWAVTGVLSFLWVAYEDEGLVVVTLLAGAWALASAISLYGRLDTARTGRQLPRMALAGALAGAAIGPLTALLMALKVGLHSHPEPDFTPADLTAALSRAWWWALIGLAFGLTMAWIDRGRSSNTMDR